MKENPTKATNTVAKITNIAAKAAKSSKNSRLSGKYCSKKAAKTIKATE